MDTLNVRGCQLSLYQQDCLEGLKQHVATESIQVAVTSPPYNLNTPYTVYRDNLKRKQYCVWLVDVLLEMGRTLAPEGSLFLNLGSKPTDPWGPMEVLFALRNHEKNPFRLQNTFHWVKAISMGRDTPVKGHTKPINSNRFVADQHEYVFHLTKTGKTTLYREAFGVGVPYADSSNLTRGTRGRNGNVRDQGNTWFIPYKTINNRALDRPHPATFPVELPLRCLRIAGAKKGDTVLDPFMGLATTAEAALVMETNFIGFELDGSYYEHAKAKFQQ